MDDVEPIVISADALAEAKAFEGTCTNPKNNFILGDIVWVKALTYPWWPALVMNESHLPSGVYAVLKRKLSTQTPFMYYYPKGTKEPSYGTVPKISKVPLMEQYGADKNPKHEIYAKAKPKTATLQMQLLGGIKSADEDLELTNHDRIRKLGTIIDKRRVVEEENNTNTTTSAGGKKKGAKAAGKGAAAAKKEEEDEEDEGLSKILESTEGVQNDEEEEEEEEEKEEEEESEDDYSTYIAKNKDRKSRKDRTQGEGDLMFAAINSGDDSDGMTGDAPKSKKRGRKKRASAAAREEGEGRDSSNFEGVGDDIGNVKKKHKSSTSAAKPGRPSLGGAESSSKLKLEREKQVEKERLEKMKLNTDVPVWKQYLGNNTTAATTTGATASSKSAGSSGILSREEKIRALLDLLSNTSNTASGTSDSDKVVRILKKFEEMNLTYSELKVFKIAEIVSNLRKHNMVTIANAAKSLRQHWIETVKGAGSTTSSSSTVTVTPKAKQNSFESLANPPIPAPAPLTAVSGSENIVSSAAVKDHTNEEWDVSLVPEIISANIVRRRCVRLLHTTIGVLKQSMLIEEVALEQLNGNLSGSVYSHEYLNIINFLTFSLRKSNNKHVLSTLRNSDVSRDYVVRVVTSKEFLYE